MNPVLPEYQPVPIEPQEPVQQRDPYRVRVTCGPCGYFLCSVVVVASILLQVFLLRRKVSANIGRNRFDPFLTSSIASQASQCGCPRLGIFPFDTGCPANCASHRIGLDNVTFYKTSSAFVFGNLQSFRQQRTPNESFHGGTRVAQSFLAREKAVVDSVMARVKEANLPPLSVHRQSYMHMSVDYLCCLTEQERTIAQNVRAQWVAQHFNNFPLELGRVQCFQERKDSITLIWIADGLAQQLLVRANDALANAMRSKGVPVLVERSLQMPFHATLVAFRVSAGQDISRYRKVIHAGVEASGFDSLKTHVSLDMELGAWEFSWNSSEMNYPTFLNVENAKWYVEEECIA